MMFVRSFLAVLFGLLLAGSVTAQTINFEITDVHCHGDANGSINLTVSGGVAPFTYVWSNSATTEDVENLPAGPYTVTVTDSTGATVTGSATLLEPAALELQTTVAGVRCFGESNGSINLSVSGGAAPYSYKWSSGPISQHLYGVVAGTYGVTVTDTGGCTGAISATVAEPAVLTWGANSTDPTCNMPNGSIDPTVLGGTMPYTFYWSNGSTQEDQYNLLAGQYAATVFDANACKTSGSISLSNDQGVNILIPSIFRPTCGQNDGKVIVNVSGGTQPYQYNWPNGATTQVVENLAPGSYTVTVTDANSCSATRTIDVTPFYLVIVSTLTQSQCYYQLQATASFEGVPPYTYQWSNGSTIPVLLAQPPGTYSVTATDATGCTSVTSVDLPQPVPLVAGIDLNPDACTGGLKAYGVNFTPTSYLWSNGATTAKISDIPAGTYSVTVTGLPGCSASATIVTTQALTADTINLNTQFANVSCTGSYGIMYVTASGNAPPFTFAWSNGATTSSLHNLSIGDIFSLTVTNANSCTTTRMNFGPGPSYPIAFVSYVPSGCNGLGRINISPSGSSPFTFIWSTGATTEDVNVLPGTYTVTITGSNNCSSTYTFTLPQGTPMAVSIQEISNSCSGSVLRSVVTGSGVTFTHHWSGPGGFVANTQVITAPLSGIYTVTVTSSTGCIVVTSYAVNIYASGPCGAITGKITNDLDENCIADASEPGLNAWIVRATNATDTMYGFTNEQGQYTVFVPVGTYVLEAVPPNGLWAACPPGNSLSVTADNTVTAEDIPVKPLGNCPALSVSIGAGAFRRCFPVTYSVRYCNNGNALAEDAYILLTLDPFLMLSETTHPYTDLGNGVLRFDVGDLDLGDCGTFWVYATVSCDAVLGQAHCTEAHIYPDGTCLVPNQEWSGASLRLSSQCLPDSVYFTIKNVGVADMQSSSDYIVVEDAVMLYQGGFQLNAGDSTITSYPANGSTWRMEVDQVDFHPGLSSPGLSVEGCSNAPQFSTGFVTQFANDDMDPWIDIDCRENTGSFDPNDKQGFPVGYGSEHYIRPGTELEYLIRFQNTGTDTAFTVRVADTLSAWLDPATIRAGVSSHPYQFNLSGPGFVEFLFENILLPDSNINQIASNGFVKFSIYPRADAPLETLIENSAAIYFDFNEPVITNTTWHRLGENFLTVGLWQPEHPEYQVLVSPNPFNESARLEVKGLTSSQPIRLQVFDLQGVVVHEETASGPVLHLKKGSLKTGLYLFRLDQKGAMIGHGKLMVKD